MNEFGPFGEFLPDDRPGGYDIRDFIDDEPPPAPADPQFIHGDE